MGKTLEPLPYFKWLWRDWRANRKVQRLDYVARGLYRELLDEQWSEGCIPKDTEVMAEICGCPTAVMDKHWASLAQFFDEQEDGTLVNSKLEQQRTEEDKVRAKKARGGRKSALIKATASRHVQEVLKTSSEPEITSSEAQIMSSDGDKTSHIAEQSRAEKEQRRVEQETEPADLLPENDGQEDEVKATKEIPILCQAILNTPARLYPDQVSLIKTLEAEHKGSAVVQAFGRWAREHRYDDLRNPVKSFLEVAADYLGAPSASDSVAVASDANKLARELAFISDGKVTFDDKQRNRLGELLKEFSFDEVVSAFREFLGNKQGENPAFFARDFSQGGDQIADNARRRKQQAVQTAAVLESESERLAREAADERARNKPPAEEVEETLGGDE